MLELVERDSQFPEEFAAGGFEEIEVAAVIDVISDGAIGVGDTMLMAKNLVSHGRRLKRVGWGVEVEWKRVDGKKK